MRQKIQCLRKTQDFIHDAIVSIQYLVLEYLGHAPYKLALKLLQQV